jgi:hypothetical protein
VCCSVRSVKRKDGSLSQLEKRMSVVCEKQMGNLHGREQKERRPDERGRGLRQPRPLEAKEARVDWGNQGDELKAW